MKKLIFKYIIFSLVITGCRSNIEDEKYLSSERFENEVTYSLENEDNKIIDNNINFDKDNIHKDIKLFNDSPTPINNGAANESIPKSVVDFYNNNLMWLSCCTEHEYFLINSAFLFHSEKFGQNIVITGINSGSSMFPCPRHEKLSALFAGKVKYENDYKNIETDLKNYIRFNSKNEEGNYVMAFTVLDSGSLTISSVEYNAVQKEEEVYLVASRFDYSVIGDDVFRCKVDDVDEKKFTFSSDESLFYKENTGGILLNKFGKIIGVHVYNKDQKSIAYKIKYIIEDVESGEISKKEYPVDFNPYEENLDRFKTNHKYIIDLDMDNEEKIYINYVEFLDSISDYNAPKGYMFAVFDVKVRNDVSTELFRLGAHDEIIPFQINNYQIDLSNNDNELDTEHNGYKDKIIFLVPSDMDFDTVLSYEDYSIDF